MSDKAQQESTPISGVDAQNPWPGLVAFTEELRPFFHGRAEEADDLLRRVMRRDLTVVFGQSGLGKSSLLQAGLVPRLRAEGYLPVSIRLDHSAQAPTQSEQVKAAVARAIIEAEGRCEASPPEEGDTLWEHFHRRTLVQKTRDGQPVRLVLLFDQFEELFSIGQAGEATRSRAASFLKELADLVENRAPVSLEHRLEEQPELVKQFVFDDHDNRALVSLREDYLPQLESLRQMMPSISENRMRLTRMNGTRALEAVLNPAGRLITPEVGRQVVRFVAGGRVGSTPTEPTPPNDDDLAELEVEPSLLSLVCRELNNQRLALGLPQITADLLAGNRERILQDFYERCVADQPPAVRAFVEDELVTDSGLRENIALERARKTLTQRGAPGAAIDELVKRRLLHLEERLDIQRVELTHDVLTPVVTRSRDDRQQREATLRAKMEAQQVRDKARRQRRRLGWIVAGMAAALVIVGGFGLWSYHQYAEATIQKERAERNEKEAEASRQIAEKNEELATNARIEAEASRQIADKLRKLADKRIVELARACSETSCREFERGNATTAVSWMFRALEIAPPDDPLRPFYRRMLAAQVRDLEVPLVLEGAVSCMTYSPDSQRILTGSADNAAIIWDAVTGKRLAILEHEGKVRAVAFSPDGRLVLTGSDDKTARLWRGDDGKPIATLRHESGVSTILFSPIGKRVLTRSVDKTARLWDVDTGKAIATIEDVTAATFGSNGRQLITGSNDKTARIWEANTGISLATLKHEGSVLAVAVSPDSRQVLTGSADKTARLWEATTGKAGAILKHESDVFDVTFSPDGKQILTGSKDSTARIWEAADGKPGARLKHEASVSAVSFSPNGQVVLTASSDSTLKFWLLSGDAIGTPIKSDLGLPAVAFSPDGKHFIVGGDDKIAKVCNVGSENVIASFKYDCGLQTLAFSPDCRQVVLQCDDKTIRLWNVPSDRSLARPISNASVVAFTTDCSLVLTQNWSGSDLLVSTWNVTSGKQLAKLKIEPGDSSCTAISPDGQMVVDGGSWENKTAHVWELATGKNLANFKHESQVQAVAFSPDGRRVFTGGYNIGMRLSDVESGKEYVNVKFDAAVQAVAFSADGSMLLTGNSDKSARVWDAATGKELANLKHDGVVQVVAFSPDGRQVLTGSASTVRLWDVAKGKELQNYRHNDTVRALAFSPDGQQVLTGGDDASARLWDAASGKQLANFRHDYGLRALAFSPDGKQILTGALDAMQRWDVVINPLPEDEEQIRAWVHVATGSRFDELGQLEGLRPDELISWSKKLQLIGGDWRPRLSAWEWHTRQSRNTTEPFAIAFHLGKLIALGDDSAETLLRRANAHYRFGLFDRALADYLVLTKRTPHDPAAWRGRGCASIKLNQLGDAKIAFQKACELKPQDPSLGFQLGFALVEAGDLRAYQHKISEILELPSIMVNEKAYYLAGLGIAGQEKGVWVQTILALAEKADKLSPKDWTCQWILGAAHYRNGHYLEAIRVLKSASDARVSVEDQYSDPGAAFHNAFLAMAHHKAGPSAADAAFMIASPALATTSSSLSALIPNALLANRPRLYMDLADGAAKGETWENGDCWKLLRAEAENVLKTPR